MFVKMRYMVCAILMGLMFLVQGAWAEPNGSGVYAMIMQHIDQGDAKAATDTLLAAQNAEEIYQQMSEDYPTLLDSVFEEAVCFYNEDGELYNIVDLRLRGFLSDHIFLGYWERMGMDVHGAVTDHAQQNNYDEYLLCELLNWYDRGERVRADIADLRWLGMIDDALYAELVKAWNVDLMDNVDHQTYIPLYGMQLSEQEKEKIRAWQVCVDEGKSREAIAILIGDKNDDVYRWLLKNDAQLVDMVHAQAMFENAVAGEYEPNIHLMLSGFVSDACFERYWALMKFTSEEESRMDEAHQGVDMYFVDEVERICEMKHDPHLVQWLWEEKLIDTYTFDVLINRIGGWEAMVEE